MEKWDGKMKMCRNGSLPKGMLFDLDDTIVAFKAVADTVWKEVCEKYAEYLPTCDTEELYTTINSVRRWYWGDPERHKEGRHRIEKTRRKIVRNAFKRLEMDNHSLAHEIADAYSTQRLEAMHLFPGAKETLTYLTDHGVSLTLVTNGPGPYQRAKIERFDLERFFSSILIEGELGYGKPERKIYLRALEELGLEPEEVWSVGDNLKWEVEAPQQLGIYSVWHDYKRGGLPPGSKIVPDRIIHRIAELVE